MNLTITPNGMLQIDNARMIWRNFTGAASQYNREGNREFNLVVETEEQADALTAEGWNIKVKPPKEEGDTPLMLLKVAVKFNDRGPAVYLISAGQKTRLTEETVGLLDHIDIESVDMDIRPYDWEVNGKCGRKAYLQALQVTQRCNRFDDLPPMPQAGDEEKPFM